MAGGRHAEPRNDGCFTFIQERFNAWAPACAALNLLLNCGHVNEFAAGRREEVKGGKGRKMSPKTGLQGGGKS